MASLLRSLSANTHHICRRQYTSRYYTESAYQIAQQKWKLQGVPRPRSILEDDEAPVDLSEDNEAVNGQRPNTPPSHLRSPPEKPTPHEFKAHQQSMRKAFPDGWAPPRKLSREAMNALRQLHHSDPEMFKTPILADKFRISPEAVRRILKSKWEPSAEKRTALVVKERREKEEFWKSVDAKKQSTQREVEHVRKHIHAKGFVKDRDGGFTASRPNKRHTGVGFGDRFEL